MHIKYGLTTAQAEESKAKYGDNTLSTKESQSLWSMFVDSFKDKWIIILILALCIKIAFNFIGMMFPELGHADWFDVISILAAILLSTGFSTISSYRNEQKFNALQEEASKIKTKVYRDGVLVELLIDRLVKGDIVLLQAGDQVPADGIILEGSCKVNQAALNGESEDAKKIALGDNPVPDSGDLFTELKIFRGTVVTSGEAIMEVTEIGDATVLGSINTSLQEDNKESPSTEKLNRLADGIGVLGYSGGTISAIINMVLGIIALNSVGGVNVASVLLLLMESVMFGVSIIIMAVPEGLPMMMALVSAMNSGKLLAQNILVRHSETIETAGYMNILFSDKTGTITEGTLSVVDMLLGNGKLVNNLKDMCKSLQTETIKGMGLNNDANVSGERSIGSNGTDRALLDYLITNDALSFNREDIVSKEAFSSATKFASVTTKDGVTYIKGAPEFIMKDCKYYLDENGNKQPFTAEVSAALDEASLAQANRAMRLLAVMKKEKGSDDKILITILCIRDNVRADVKQTVETMNRAGVQVVMVTGDRKETAVAIAKESGIITNPDDVVLTHDELDAMDDETLKELMPRLKVVSRALPMDKKRLVNIAQSLDLVCGMTGKQHCPVLQKCSA